MGIPAKQYSPHFDEGDATLSGSGSSKVADNRHKDTDRVKDQALGASQSFKRALDQLDDTSEVQAPLNMAEAEAIQIEVAKMVQRVGVLQEKVSLIQSQVDDNVGAFETARTSYSYDLKKRPRLKAAMKAVFGSAKPVLTYEDYLRALDLKRSIEAEETRAVFQEESFDG
jgi:hypothetical protein